jgi:paraquat-inducible protein A
MSEPQGIAAIPASAPAPAPAIARNPAATWLVRLLVLVAAGLLGVGLVAPCMTIVTSFGRYEGWLRLLAPDMLQEEPSTYSLLGGIIAIMRHDNLGLGLLLLAFSCVFPTLKLMLMAWSNEALAVGRPAGLMFRLAHHSGKFSMLDVMVLALLVIAIKGLPGSRVRIEWGVAAFAASVVLSLLISLLLHRAENRGVAKRLQLDARELRAVPEERKDAKGAKREQRTE